MVHLQITHLEKKMIFQTSMLIFTSVINAGNMAASLPELVANQLEAGGPQNDGPRKAGNFPLEKNIKHGDVCRVVATHPYLGKIPILTNIFQLGWNHQLVWYLC